MQSRRLAHRLFLSVLFTGIFSSCIGFVWEQAETLNESIYKSDGDEDKIIGGSPSAAGAYPFQAFVTWNASDGRAHACAGTLIDSNRVLTAAHCVYQQTPSTYKLYFNTLQNPWKGTDPNWITRKATKLQAHESYNPYTLTNDIAIITLDSPVTNLQFSTLPMGDDGNFCVGCTATAIGWGLTANINNASYVSDKLLEVQLPVIDRNTCNNLIGFTVASDKMCTNADGKNVCHGDSGGPLLINGVQVGISSHVSAINDCGSAGAYTRTANYTSWIQGTPTTTTTTPTPFTSTTPTPTPGKAFIRRILLALLALFSK